MKTHYLTTTLLLVLSAPSCSRFGTRELVGLPSIGGLLDSSQAQAVYERAKFFPNGTQISIAILREDAATFVGIERRNDSLLYIDNADSVFEIGSITKTFTGTMLAKLVYEGKAGIDDPVQQYLPVTLKQSSLNGKEVSLVELAEHTSGLPFEPDNLRNDDLHPFDPYSPYENYDSARLYRYLARDLTLQATPGEKRIYSNLGAGLLGHILTRIAGKSYEELLSASICAPLGMKSTFVTPTAERMRRMVQGRDPAGRPLPFGGGDCGALTGAGGVKSTARDLVKYLIANITDTTFFLLAQKPTRKFDEHFSGALGWAPYSDRGMIHQGAFGATGGYTCGVIFERKHRVGVVVLTNVSAFLAPRGKDTESLCRALYDPMPFAAGNQR